MLLKIQFLDFILLFLHSILHRLERLQALHVKKWYIKLNIVRRGHALQLLDEGFAQVIHGFRLLHFVTLEIIQKLPLFFVVSVLHIADNFLLILECQKCLAFHFNFWITNVVHSFINHIIKNNTIYIFIVLILLLFL